MKQNIHVRYNIVYVILILSFAVCLILSTMVFTRKVAQAQTGGLDIPCKTPQSPPSNRLELAKEIVALRAQDMSVGTFWENTITVSIAGDNATVCLSASPLDLKPFQVDDQIQLLVTNLDSGKTDGWVYDFYDQNTKGIIPSLRVQDISRLFSQGRNSIKIFLRDQHPRVYSTTPLWVWIWQGTPPTTTPTSSNTPTSTFTPTLTNSPTRTFTPTPTNLPIPIISPTPTSIPTRTNPEPTPPSWFTMSVIIAGGVLGLILVIIIFPLIRSKDS